LLVTSRRGPHRKQPSIIAPNCCIIKNLLHSNGNVFAELWEADSWLPELWHDLEQCNVACMCDYRRGLDWQLDLLNTYRS
jgi:hypothetical protein